MFFEFFHQISKLCFKMSSNSSEDEDLDKLREAADDQFLNNALYNKTKSKSEEPQNTKQESLRRSKDEDDQFNLFRVSPEFQNYVAKHLSQILDKMLKDRFETKNYENFIKPKRRKSRIKLLRDSPHYISVKIRKVMPQVKKSEVEDESDNEAKFRTVVVSPDDILSKKDTKHWSTRSKAPVYTYYQTEQGLILK
ncbi:protein CUSTOS-like [Tribolium madens]|uniref:protein CUSTOS-like n=1 Tax=Tribolium madens TaxID=41895 RepID=UPI001CF7201C|nr:protein CUSTOS-like [Tribolium madens]